MAIETAGDRWTPPPDDPEAWPRLHAAGKAAFGRLNEAAWLMVFGTGVATVLAIAPHLLGWPVVQAMLLGMVAAGVALALASIPSADRDLRRAMELFWNHQFREAREWKAETGTRMPRGRAAIARWLDEHPEGPGRGTLLTSIGRFAEAERAWTLVPHPGPDEAFGIEIQRETAFFLAGLQPDLGRLRDLWMAMPDIPERAQRRECLALLEAECHPSEAIRLIAEARAESAPIVNRARFLGVFATFFLVPLVATVAVGTVRLLVP